ncbi:hypothetical protein DOTSEDRAFT_70848 [Dothistroma septosporum NZE10]|uniref:Uncharacterized protein n=1 Tax=Dothistroma septosporum (strain NZE10 / CBS 128990) TaxID=675120 RepID=N1PNF5_DOTSN|nr:hypothetical protein DOTSEDRAFT_70848 [Dothistroma septosporum NZE10]
MVLQQKPLRGLIVSHGCRRRPPGRVLDASSTRQSSRDDAGDDYLPVLSLQARP